MRCSVVERGTGTLFGVETIEAPLKVPARDIPYFVDVQIMPDNITVNVTLGFSGRREDICEFTKGHSLLRFGSKTGRIYAMVISQCDTGHPWKDQLRHMEKDIAGKSNNRFSRNLIYGLLLAEGVILALWKGMPKNTADVIVVKRTKIQV